MARFLSKFRARSTSAILGAIILGLAGGFYSPAVIAEIGHKERPKGVLLDPLYALRTTDGRAFLPADIKDRPFVVVFGFTHCPDVCPTTLTEMSAHLSSLGAEADRIKILFVTVDPERDTDQHLKTYMQSFDPRIIALTGGTFEVTAVAQAFGAFFEKVPTDDGGGYTIDHTKRVFMMDKYGLLAHAAPSSMSGEEKLAVLRKLLAQ